MNEHDESDSPVVPGKQANKAAQAAAEPVEERGLAGFCANRIENRPERLGSDLVLVHSPAAANCFPFDCMQAGQEWFLRPDVKQH